MILKDLLKISFLIVFCIANAKENHEYGCVASGLPQDVCKDVKDLYNHEATKQLKGLFEGRNVLIYKDKYYINNLYPVLKAKENYLQLSDILELTGKEGVKDTLNKLYDQLREYHKLKIKKENVDDLEQEVKTKALFFAKVLFEYIHFFNPKFPVPDLSTEENFDDILNADKKTLDIWGSFLTDIKNLKLSNLFMELTVSLLNVFYIPNPCCIII